LTQLAPGPGNYNPNDNAVWNKIARDNADKKGAPATSKAKTEDKKDKGEKKKGEKPFPGPGQYEIVSQFKSDPKVKAVKEKKEEKEGKKDKKENNYIFGEKIIPVPGPGT